MHFSIPELLVVLAIAILLFGVGRISKVSGEIGKSIRSLREGLSGTDPEAKQNHNP